MIAHPTVRAVLLPRATLILFLALLGFVSAHAADLPTLWAERTKSVVAVEYLTETEVDRRPTVSLGTVIDAKGTIILPREAIDPRAAVWQLKEFKVYLPGDATGSPAEYLGPDAYTGWHFVRANEQVRAKLVPVTNFVAKTPKPAALADFVWGIGLRDKDEDFMPYIMQSNVALIQSLPQRTGIAQQDVAAPGLPVFNRDGDFVGLSLASFGQSYLQFSRTNQGGGGVILINVEESSVFLTAEEVLPYLGRLPKSVSGRPLAWLGAYGMEPMDRDVAKFLNLSTQSGAVVSEVLEDSPAEKAGLKNRDIILALDGKPLPQLKPDRVVVSYIDREITRRAPGDALAITVLRGTERVEMKATLGEQPKVVREAERKYFDRLGFTVREFVYGDAIERRVKASAPTGVVVHYIKPSSPVAIAGIRYDDWVKEIDGVEVKTLEAAVAKLSEIERDAARAEIVLLVGRGNDTAILRVKLR